MTAKDDLIVFGVIGVGLLGGLYLVSRGISNLIPSFDWKQYGKEYKAYAEYLESSIIGEKKAYGDLYAWYEGSIDTINELNKKIAEMKNDALMNPPKLVVHPGVTALGSNLNEMLERSETATKNIKKAVSSGVDTVETVRKEINKVIASKAPGWMPVGVV